MIFHLFVHLLTHRDYGPFDNAVSVHFSPVLRPRRLNIAYPRGEITPRLPAIS
jgi:hypothetical protein